MGELPKTDAALLGPGRRQFLSAFLVVLAWTAPAVAVCAAEFSLIPRKEWGEAILFLCPIPLIVAPVIGAYFAGRRAYPHFVGLALLSSFLIVLVLFGFVSGEISLEGIVESLPAVFIVWVLPGFLAAVVGRRGAMKRSFKSSEQPDS